MHIREICVFCESHGEGFGVMSVPGSIYADLQKATSVLSTEQADQNRAEEDRLQHAEDVAESTTKFSTPITDLASEREADVAESGNPDFSRLSPSQIDRLELGFQHAIFDDRRLHRMFIFLDDLYAALGK